MTEEQIMQLHQEITDIIAEYIIFQKKKYCRTSKKNNTANTRVYFMVFK